MGTNSIDTKDALAVILIYPILTVVSIIFWGFSFSYLWLWFIVPLGLSKIGLFHAAGITVLCKLVSSESSARALYLDKEFDKNQVISKAAASFTIDILKPAITLFLGFIISFFV